MKILIVDDDEIIRKTFLEQIPWEENGYEIVAAASNGEEAYEIALYTCPDIILTDIEMPVMNGLELAEKLQEVLEGCRIIFLTAYDSFEYAREALRLHACEYILKDSQEEEVLQALEREAEEIRIRNRQVHLTGLGRELLERNRIFRLLQDNITEEEKKSICQDLEMDLQSCRYQVAVVKMADRGNGQRRASEAVAEEDELGELLKECLKNREGRSWIFYWNRYQVILAESSAQGDGQADFLKMAENMAEELEKRQFCGVTIGIGRLCCQETAFSSSFDDAVFAVNDDSQGKIRFYRELGQAKFIREIREYILKNYADPELSLNKLSEQVYLTPAYISSLFKRYMNSNFKEYLVRLRMKEACKLLENTDMKSYEISALVGYPNPQYFSVLFKKYMGETPTQYHNRLQEAKKER